MITAAVLFLARFVGPKAAKPALIIGSVILTVMALGVAKCSYDRAIIENHDAQQEAEIATKARPADAKAAETRRNDEANIAHDQQEITNALAPLPDVPVTDRQRARACAIWMRQNPHAAKPAGC